MKALITGATGLIGRQLVPKLDTPAILSRRSSAASQLSVPVRAWAWQPESMPAPAAAFDGVETVFHLAGESVAGGRWTAEKKRKILESRVLGTRHLVQAMSALPVRPRVLVSTSAVGYYGDRGDEELDESAAPGDGFLAEVCRAWEAEARAAEALGVRVVILRVGLVLSLAGGALAQMLPVFRLGLGGRLGTGRQWMSWVHIDDVIGLMLHAAARESVRGPVNVVSPNPVQNEEFTRELARALRRPAALSVPRVALRVGLGELADGLLASQRVAPRAALASGYSFLFAELGPALASCLRASV